MIPVSVLPAAGLLVALGRALQSTDSTTVKFVGELCYSGGLAIFEQLPLIFAIGVAIGFTSGAGVAGLAAAAGYYTLTNILKVLNTAQHLELNINTGVFGGIIVGLLTAQLYKRFSETQLHPVLGFFSGKRLVPIVTVAASLFLGLALGVIWPPIQSGINHFGLWIMDSAFGPAFFASGKRLLIPLGLHHVYYQPFLFQFGEFTTEAGKVITGETARYFAGDPTAGRFMASEFPLMLFGLPAAALAMYMRAKPENKKAVGGVMLAAALTSILTGITEPIEFAFTFVAPILFVFHVIAAFVSGYLTNLFGIQLGATFSPSLIDLGVGFFNQKNMSMLFVVGPIVGLVYFTVFYKVIGWLNLKTPGRETTDDMQETATDSSTSSSKFQKPREILIALGGASNIQSLEACITRLRVSVKDMSQVQESRFKALGAAGHMKVGSNNIQVIFGTQSDMLKEQIQKLMAQNVAQEVRNLDFKEETTAKVSAQVSTTDFVSPMKGKVVPLSEVPDATFANKVLGDGFAIIPSEGQLNAPFDGKIVQLFRTHHAVIIENAKGLQFLIHIGLDTVRMNGEGFVPHIKEGDMVKAGQKLLTFNMRLIEENAKSLISPIVIINQESETNDKPIRVQSTTVDYSTPISF